jgi:hypothetical protein
MRCLHAEFVGGRMSHVISAMSRIRETCNADIHALWLTVMQKILAMTVMAGRSGS